MGIKALTAAEFAADFPDDELIVYRNRVVAIEGWPSGFECLIRIPKKKIAALAAERKPPPFWRHGEIMDARPPREGEVGEVSPSS